MDSNADTQIRRRKPPEERRAEIVATASRLIADDGLSSITIRRVAEKLGVYPGLVSHYFASVDDVVIEGFALAITELMDAWFADANAAPDPAARLRRLLDHERPMGTLNVSRMWTDAWYAANSGGALREEVVRQMESGKQRLTELIDDGIASGVFATSDPRAAATRILAVLDALTVYGALGVDGDIALVTTFVQATGERELGLEPGTLAPR